MTHKLVLDLFAGPRPGGWDTGARMAGHTGPIVGIEWDPAACRTGIAAGHARIQADVSKFDPVVFAGLADGMTISPPCQGWSAAGDRKGELDRPAVYRRVAAFAAGREPDAEEWADPRSHLTAEPMRWAVALKPRWIACEQVPAVLPLWKYLGELLRKEGYNVWSGVLSAEEYGVPQTRKRAILIARRDGIPAGPPAPTHRAYQKGVQGDATESLFGGSLPAPVSMAEALGWGLPDRPSWTVTAGGTETGIAEVFGNAKCRAELKQYERQANGGARDLDAPSLTVMASHDNGNLRWTTTRPATTVQGDARIGRPGHKDREGGESQFDQGSTRVTVAEAAVLQSFPADYPWQGTKSAQYRMVGDAVPPLLAMHILRPLLAPAVALPAAV